jgi:hypothetical protein
LIRVESGKGIGFSAVSVKNSNFLVIGYFQSYRYAEQSLSVLQAIEPVSIGPELEEIVKLAEREIPLVVHFRLGDYLNESDFGIPGKSYYNSAITTSWSTGLYKSIWVFSDDIPSAKIIFPEKLSKYVRWIDNVDGSPASTLHAMRFGRGYVIANSTFSWWGAYLSMTENAPVIAPTPWFKGMDSPKELLPPNWETVNSDF